MKGASEHDIQVSVVAYLRACLPKSWLVVAIANAPRSEVAGGKEKARGTVKGFPDFMIVPPAWGWPVFFVEVKAGKLKPRPEQELVHEQLRELGYRVAVVHSIDEMREVAKEWDIPLREKGGSSVVHNH